MEHSFADNAIVGDVLSVADSPDRYHDEWLSFAGNDWENTIRSDGIPREIDTTNSIDCPAVDLWRDQDIIGFFARSAFISFTRWRESHDRRHIFRVEIATRVIRRHAQTKGWRHVFLFALKMLNEINARLITEFLFNLRNRHIDCLVFSTLVICAWQSTYESLRSTCPHTQTGDLQSNGYWINMAHDGVLLITQDLLIRGTCVQMKMKLLVISTFGDVGWRRCLRTLRAIFDQLRQPVGCLNGTWLCLRII